MSRVESILEPRVMNMQSTTTMDGLRKSLKKRLTSKAKTCLMVVCVWITFGFGHHRCMHSYFNDIFIFLKWNGSIKIRSVKEGLAKIPIRIEIRAVNQADTLLANIRWICETGKCLFYVVCGDCLAWILKKSTHIPQFNSTCRPPL